MSTKVKGDKIKEGSIPLSALATEVKDKIENAGSDWNAQPGEAGYIENKPFKKIIFDGIIESDNIIVYSYNINSSLVYISYEDKEIVHFINSGGDEEITLTWPNIKAYWNGMDRVVITNLSDSPIDSIKECISVYGYDSQLPSSSIDNTVIKTFPQKLSNDAKNQALANLGIDPVVWKYLANPYIIEKGNYLPDYLLQLLLNDNPLILNLCKIKVVTEMYDEIAGANRPYVQLCNPIASRWGDETVPYLSLECITFYNNTYHTYHAEIDIYENGEVCDIYEITE